jgi:hypothetical protein
VLPVNLQAAHFYRVGINSTSYQSFCSEDGQPVRPSAIYFTTAGATEELKAKVNKPLIVALEPKNGAVDVDPAVRELRVTFSAEMGDGFSWCGGGPEFPTIPEGQRPFWTEDHKTCVLPVQLEPGHEYQLGLNSPSHKNFQSAGGVPLEPISYSFSTTGKAAAPSPAGTAESGDAWSLAEKLKIATAGDTWAAYDLWNAYYRGRHGVQMDPEQADKWLREVVQDLWVVRVEPVDDFAPSSAGELLARINQYSPCRSGQTNIGAASFFRTIKQGDKLLGSFLSNYPDQLKAGLANVPGVKLTSVERITPNEFVEYEQSPQESL